MSDDPHALVERGHCPYCKATYNTTSKSVLQGDIAFCHECGEAIVIVENGVDIPTPERLAMEPPEHVHKRQAIKEAIAASNAELERQLKATMPKMMDDLRKEIRSRSPRCYRCARMMMSEIVALANCGQHWHVAAATFRDLGWLAEGNGANGILRHVCPACK